LFLGSIGLFFVVLIHVLAILAVIFVFSLARSNQAPMASFLASPGQILGGARSNQRPPSPRF
jgi:hypothetical protein